MVFETIAFALIGFAVGAAALALLPGWFAAARAVTVATGVVSALLAGHLTGYVLDGGSMPVQLVSAAVCSVLLVSVPARPDRAPRPRGAHRRQRPA
ncbi:hypothetical protein [Kitasatospora terrestris]|uniref:Integral membrane protein n=1 Tax=Kitasatospora terrestris TaxID=258051 RepID=A0ABP9E059_9ACTN